MQSYKTATVSHQYHSCDKQLVTSWSNILRSCEAGFSAFLRHEIVVGKTYWHGSVSKPCTPVVHIKIAGKWMFIPLKMVLVGIDPYPHGFVWKWWGKPSKLKLQIQRHLQIIQGFLITLPCFAYSNCHVGGTTRFSDTHMDTWAILIEPAEKVMW